MEKNPIDPVEYASILLITRRRRKFFFSTVLVYIPALLVTHKISPTDMAMGTLFAVWVVFLIVSTVLVALCKCPRCGNYFHMHGITLLILRKCLHCQLHIASNDIT
ncbi:MAG: hypothetical protein ACOYL3_06090 [Desulfuromonadaceae bacterium]